QSDGTYQVEVPLSNHQYNSGTYYIDIYGTNNYGVQRYLGGTTQTVTPMTVESITAGTIENGKFIVTISGINAPGGVKEILAPVWSGGHNDLHWYTAKKQSDGTYQVEVPLSNHQYNSGSYYIDVYGTNNYGVQRYLGGTSITLDEDKEEIFNSNTAIMGAQIITRERMIEYFEEKSDFPKYYEERGVSLSDFVQLYMDEANVEGVRPDIAFAQMLVETGFLKFGGQVDISQFNFAGIGATDGGAAGQSFAKEYGDDKFGIRMGIRAQVQHLKAYASTDTLVNECVDPRFKYVSRGSASVIGELGNGKWATDSTYSNKILTQLFKMSKMM
ncbi:GBS Bsp-like repeat-containing protein, partial [Eubacterium sp.]|uniref:GBS Bsp-like repeat-containing protein n=1 Tax=Eubacterium sp. TaxID=142586 RepID=UPI002FCB7E0C